MLTKIKLKNFKCFDQIEINDLREIVLLTGENNVGKSALLQSVIFLRESILNREFNWSCIQLRNFRDAVFKHETDRNIEISCEFKLTKDDKKILKNNIDLDINYIKYKISLSSDDKIVNEIISFNDIDVIQFERVEGRSAAELSFSGYQEFSDDSTGSVIITDTNGENKWLVDITGYSITIPLSWRIKSRELHQFPSIKFIMDLKEIIINKFREIKFVSDKRRISKWFGSLEMKPAELNSTGDNASIKLHYLHADRDILFDEIEKWIQKIDPEIQMIKTPIRDGGVTIELKTLLTEVNLMTAGSGLNTVIPVIMQTILLSKNGTVLIEEPEIHLHKGAQIVLFNMFLESIKDEKQIIFTTHSHDMIMAMYKQYKTSGLKEKQVQTWNILKENGIRKAVKAKPIWHFNKFKDQFKNL